MVDREIIQRKLVQLEDIEKEILCFILEEDRPVSRKDIYKFIHDDLEYMKGLFFAGSYAAHISKLKDLGLITIEIVNGPKEEWENIRLQNERIEIRPSYLGGLKNMLFMEADFCFALMPFKESTNTVWNFIRSIEVKGIKIKRADDISSAGIVIEQIYKAIENAKLIIADCSGLNPNVMYELGYAHAKDKDTIIITTDDPKDLPFNIMHRRVIRYYFFGFANLKEELRKAIIETIKE